MTRKPHDSAHPHSHSHHQHHQHGPGRREFLALLIAAGLLSPCAFALYASDNPAEMAERFRNV